MSNVTVSKVNPADTVWVLTSTALVFLMVPGVAYFYAGGLQSKNKLSVLCASFLAAGVISIEWFLWGYSVAFGSSKSKFIGNLNHIVLVGVDAKPNVLAPTIPSNCFMIFQCMFAAVTAALAFGSAAERSSLRSYIVFLMVWSVFVYDIVAYWVWSENGWLKKLGALDFAGGTPVHVVSGFSALAYGIVVGPRTGFRERKFEPVNISDVFIGTSLLWFGWFGFNGGSELAINGRAVNAVVVSNLAASMGGIAWVITEMILHRKFKISLFGFCCGAIAGLVAITPGAGYVRTQPSLIFGAVAGVVCCLSCRIKRLFPYKFDDACDVFAVHGVGGIIGSLLTGIFAETAIIEMDGGSGKGGWLNGRFILIVYQLIGVSVGAGWSFVVTFLIVISMRFIPFFKMRLDEKEESRGVDWFDLGEQGYGHDIVQYSDSEDK